jgi:hypothetical protein
MQRVRITVDPGEADLPLTFERATSDGTFGRVEVVNWNVATTPAAFLLHGRGDPARFGTLLEEDPAVERYELLPVTEGEWYCFVTGAGTRDARRLWEQFGSGSLMTIPPAVWNLDGSYTFTLVGTRADVQSAVDTVPDTASVTVEAVGGTDVAEGSLLDRLSERQRTALETAVDCGYYDVPRRATTADVARRLGCATSTAAEHLRKAESTVVRGLLDRR